MARNGTVTTEVQQLLVAARAQWGGDSVEEYKSGQFKLRPADKSKPLIYLTGKGNARGQRNARAMLRQAGLVV